MLWTVPDTSISTSHCPPLISVFLRCTHIPIIFSHFPYILFIFFDLILLVLCSVNRCVRRFPHSHFAMRPPARRYFVQTRSDQYTRLLVIGAPHHWTKFGRHSRVATPIAKLMHQRSLELWNQPVDSAPPQRTITPHPRS